jgi:hypothetical protein
MEYYGEDFEKVKNQMNKFEENKEEEENNTVNTEEEEKE